MIGLYFDQVAPRQYGSAKKWYFPVNQLFSSKKVDLLNEIKLGDEE
jgi:hypothetical protein